MLSLKRQFTVFSVASLFFFNNASAEDLTLYHIGKTEQAILLAATAPIQDMPMGQSSPSDASTFLLPEDYSYSDDDLFGTPGGGYVHPFISIGGQYSDNLFNINDDQKSNFLTEISPGIWFSLPSRKDVPLHVAPNNTSAGGLQIALPDFEGFERFNAYLLGGLNFKTYSEESDLNDYDATLEGLLKYNLRSGLSFEVMDRFTRSQDRFDIGNATAENRRQFYSNLFIGDIDWLFSEKFRAKIEYSNFFLDYYKEIDGFMNRDDNAIALFVFYNYSIKTTLFLEYQFVDVAYNSVISRDNAQNYIYAGINWLSSAKTSFLLKAGYQNRNYKDSETNAIVDIANNISNNGFALEFTFEYKITNKTNLRIGASHKIEESDSFIAIDKTVTAGTLRYDQEFTDRLHGMIDVRYERADYGQVVDNRDDQRYIFRPALQYVFRDWLMAEVAYEYDTRNSNDDLYEYDTNTFSFSLNASL